MKFAMTLVVTKLYLWEFLVRKKGTCIPNGMAILTRCKLKKIFFKQAPLDPTWPEVFELVDRVLEAQKEGYKIATWCGHDQEIMVVGYRPEQVTVQEGTPTLSCRCGHSGAILGERIARCMIEEKCMPNCTKCGSKMRVTYKE